MPGFGEKDLERAVTLLATLPYFPRGTEAAIMESLRDMCPSKEVLFWTAKTVANRFREWPGIREIRAVLCSRYTPADGVDAWSEHPEFSAEAGEMRYIEKQSSTIGGQLAGESVAIIKQLTGAVGDIASPKRAPANPSPEIEGARKPANTIGREYTPPEPRLQEHKPQPLGGFEIERLQAEAEAGSELARQLLEKHGVLEVIQ